jgi:hypothetical protein
MPTIDLVSFNIAFLLGLIIVVSTSIEIFNQPSYSRDPGKLKKKYKRALRLYLLAIAALYSFITFFPEVLSGLGADAATLEKIISRPTWPLAAVSFVIGLQSLVFIRQFEELCRSKLHKWAKIPEGARETINRLKKAGFNFKLYNNENVLHRQEFAHVTQNVFEKEQPSLEIKWVKICCILFNLRMAEKSETDTPGGFNPSAYDTDFFQEYDEEYREIETLHERLTNTVSLYKELKNGAKENNQGSIQTLKESLEKDVDDLLERVYTFIACAVRSKQSTESEVYAILSKLGFSLPSSKEKPIDLNALITFLGSTGILIILIVLTGSYIFPLVIDPEILAAVDYMKGGAVIAVVWALSTVCCHGSAALVALSYRRSQIAKDNWKEPNGTGTRSLHNYLISALRGGLVGYIFLMVIVIIYIAVDKVSIFREVHLMVKMFLEMGLENLIWIFAIGCTGWFAVHHYDTYYEESSKPDYVSKAGLQAAAMAVIGFVCAMVYTEIWHYHNPPSDELIGQNFMPVRLLFSLFVAGVLSLMGAVMGYWFAKGNYGSLFRTIRIDCRYADLHLPVGAAIYENGKKIGGNGEWITLFNRRHTLAVECDQLGAAKRSEIFDIDLVNEKSEIVKVAVQTA